MTFAKTSVHTYEKKKKTEIEEGGTKTNKSKFMYGISSYTSLVYGSVYVVYAEKGPRKFKCTCTLPLERFSGAARFVAARRCHHMAIGRGDIGGEKRVG